MHRDRASRLRDWLASERRRWRGGARARVARHVLSQAATPPCPFCGQHVGISILTTWPDNWPGDDNTVGVRYYCARDRCRQTFVGTTTQAALDRRERLIGQASFMRLVETADRA